jgi:hypothetical protein
MPEMTDLAAAAEQLGLGLTPKQIEPFIKNHSTDEATQRFEKLAGWMAQVNSQNHDGVVLTPAIINYLAGGSDFDALLNTLDHLRQDTRNGRFDINNLLQKELEYRRYTSEANRQRDWPKAPNAQRAAFNALTTLPPLHEDEFQLTSQDRVEAKRAAYEAKVFLEFLMEFRSQTDRPIVVVGNERYGRHWVVEPLEAYLKGRFEVRYDRVPSHGSMRLTVPHYLERFQRNGFPPEFMRQLSEQMPHVVIVDECSPRRTEHYTKFPRGVRDLVNWFMVFNDIRAEGDGSKYEADSTLPAHHFPELKKWYEFVVVRRRIREWVTPGPTYKIAHWAPELKEQALMGDMIIPSKPPDFGDEKPQVILANPAIYRTEGDDLPAILKGTHPYYFNDPEKRVREEIVPGFGLHGFETRVKGFTTDEHVAAIQEQIQAELATMLSD